MRRELRENLERVQSSTNLIENLLSRMREIRRRVRRWQGGTMILRWTAPGCWKPNATSARSSAIVLSANSTPHCRAHDAAIDPGA